MRLGGPRVARLFQLLLGVVFVDAWASFLFQAEPLFGTHGLSPVSHLLGGSVTPPLWQWPTLFRWLSPDVVDGALYLVGVLGLALAAIVLFSPGRNGVRARVALALSTIFYLSVVNVGGAFFGFQWDNLLIECGAFAVLLPTDRRSPVMHVLFRLLLFKLYFESGLAKLQSDRGDWTDGSALTHYFETAPLPTVLALYAHALPAKVLQVLTWSTLLLELGVPFLIFGNRKMRLIAFYLFSGFQIINALTANYGFFCYLSFLLGVVLFEEDDIAGWLVAPRAVPLPPTPTARVTRTLVEWGALALFAFVSVIDGCVQFLPGPKTDSLSALTAPFAPFRAINNYHLFAAVTVERIEPEIQIHPAAAPPDEFMPLELHHKPGAVDRRPDFVAPHQPRLDFQLWFYGLSYRRTPPYVLGLLESICRQPFSAQRLFATHLMEPPDSVRIVFWQYQLTTPKVLWQTGAYWTRRQVAVTKTMPCAPVE